MLLLAAGVMAQPSPDDMFISVFVVDQNGQAVPNHEVCVTYVSNNPSLPTDSICATTNPNGLADLFIPNGSLTGPNVDFEVSVYDPCALIPQTQTISNQQGTVDNATITFAICANGQPCNAAVDFVASNDSTLGANGVWTFVANPVGTAPFTYDWWVDGASYNTQTVQHTFSGGTVGVYLTITDANGCDAFAGDTLYLNGNNQGCSVSVGVSEDSLNNVLNAELWAVANGVAPFTYLWSTGETTESIYLQDIQGLDTICLTITDAVGCVSTSCEVVGWQPIPPCQVEITTVIDSTPNGMFYVLSASGINGSYSWSIGNAIGQTITIPASEISPNGEVICVTGYDVNGCIVSACDTLYGTSQGNCDVTIISEQDSANPYLFWLTAVPSGTGPFTYSWDNGSTSQATQYVLNGMGMYGACVTVTDATGCTSFNCDTLLPNVGGNCEAGMFYNGNPNGVLVAEDTVQFYYNGTIEQGNSYVWTFQFAGQMITSTEMNPVFVIPPTLVALGQFEVEVCVTVNSPDGCTDTHCEWATVLIGAGNALCSASFATQGPTAIGYTFTADIQNSDLYYYWEVDNAYAGDGYELYVPGFANGSHTICLMVVDSLNNCSDQQCETIVVGSPNCLGYVMGQVYAGSNSQPLDEGVVYLITFDPLTNQLSVVDSTYLDSANHYFFGPLDCGNYMVKAAALPTSQYYNGHIPTYYGNSPFWAFAQTVSLGQSNTQVLADITLIASNNPGGPGFIGGDVSEGANKWDEGDPIGGMLVLLFDINGNAIDYTYTNGPGEFEFPNLAYGTYQVYAEVLGVQTIPAVVTISQEQPTFDEVHIIASETLITTGIEELDFESAVGEVYPNPVVNNLSINFNFDDNVMVNISIVDLSGRTISTNVESISAGENVVRLDANELQEGYYFLNIQDVEGQFNLTRKFFRID